MKPSTKYWIAIGTLAAALMALAVYTFVLSKPATPPKPQDFIPDVNPYNPPANA